MKPLGPESTGHYTCWQDLCRPSVRPTIPYRVANEGSQQLGDPIARGDFVRGRRAFHSCDSPASFERHRWRFPCGALGPGPPTLQAIANQLRVGLLRSRWTNSRRHVRGTHLAPHAVADMHTTANGKPALASWAADGSKPRLRDEQGEILAAHFTAAGYA